MHMHVYMCMCMCTNIYICLNCQILDIINTSKLTGKKQLDGKTTIFIKRYAEEKRFF